VKPDAVDTFRCAAAVVARPNHDRIGVELAEAVASDLPDGRADLCLLFASAHLEDQIERLVLDVHERLRPGALIGTTGESVIAGETEYESQPAATLWAARMPDVELRSFHFSKEDLDRFDQPEKIQDYLRIPGDAQPYFVLLADPSSINPLQLLARLQQGYPGRATIGGMSSAGDEPRQNAVFFDGQTLRHGACGVGLWGAVHVECVVSQGCRPIGRQYQITEAERNVILSLGGRTPLEVVRDLLRECSSRERTLARQRGLLIGCAVREPDSRQARTGFLIRNPMRFIADTGALEVDEFVRAGQTVQFQVRDSATADEDLTSLLSARQSMRAAGALLFSCNGRGTRLFPSRHHDARAVRDTFGPIPSAGFFCAGEIGPIGQRNFLHGHAASIGLFGPAAP
jgi:small ligand-binding sensory domain FIST